MPKLKKNDRLKTNKPPKESKIQLKFYCDSIDNYSTRTANCASTEAVWSLVTNSNGPLPRPRFRCRAVAIEDFMLVFGSNKNGTLSDLSIYNTVTNTWIVINTKGDIPPGLAEQHTFVVDGSRLLVFTGIMDDLEAYNNLYELQIYKWEWKKLKPKLPKFKPPPYPRLGHSFTLIGSKVYLFGGLVYISNNSKSNLICSNDLYTLDIHSNHLEWNYPSTIGPSPPPRESHTGESYFDHSINDKFLVIYGGIKENIILHDLWVLYTSTMTWMELRTSGITRPLRYLHTSTVIGDRMFVFGGRVPFNTNNKKSKCTNSLECLNLVTLNWDEVYIQVDPEANSPCIRSGHCAVSIGNKIYIWSGEDMFREKYYQDLWCLEVEKPASRHITKYREITLGVATTDESTTTKSTSIEFSENVTLKSNEIGENKMLLDLYNTEKNTRYCPERKRNVYPKCASRGLVVDGHELLVFGGIPANNQYCNDLNEQVSKWEWRKLTPKPPEFQPLPRPRMGQSFQLIGSKVYLFTGVANINGNSKIISGGNRRDRILEHLWVLDTATMIEMEVKTSGIIRLLRCLRSSSVVGHRMYVFGDRVLVSTNNQESMCTNSLECSNLVRMNWDEVDILVSPKASLSCARSSHCAIGIGNKIYIWSGEDTFHGECFQDLWFCEIIKPPASHCVKWVKAITKSIATTDGRTTPTKNDLIEGAENVPLKQIETRKNEKLDLDMKSKCDPLNNLVLWKYVPNPTGFLPFPRHGHRAIAIKDLIFVFGGGEKRLFNDLMVYYIEKNIWLCPKITGNVPPECTAHGLVVDGTRLLVFGGLLENNQFSNDLYELKAQKWEWTKLAPKPPKSGPLPYPRFGHSFTLVKSEVYLFGGLANIGVPKFLNDLYTLNIRNSPLEWVIPQTKGSSPPPREFHTGVAYIDQKGHSFLVIYGGKNGLILGDLWVLNIETMSWIEPKTSGIAPLPRYFHSSIVIRNRMFVFGGRVSVGTDDQASECTNNLICLNLETMNWDNLVIQVDPKANLPCARSGHCAVGIETRIYIWSGQDMDQKKCLQDLWFVDVDKPPPPTGLRWVKNFIFTWKNPLFVDYNMLEIEKVSLPSPPPYSPTMSPASSLGSTPESSQASTPESTRADIPESSRAYRPESSRASTLESSRADIPESSRADIPESSRAYRPESSRAYIPESSRASSTYKAESDTSEPEYLFAPHPNYKFIMMVARNEAIRKKQRKKSNSLKDKGILSKLKLSSAKSKIKIKVSSLIGKRPMPKSKAVLDSSTPNVKSIKKVKTKKKVINSEK